LVFWHKQVDAYSLDSSVYILKECFGNILTEHQAMVGYSYQERNGSMLTVQNPSVTNLAQPEESS